MTAFVVVNPKAANGRTGRDWPAIRALLEDIFPMMTVATSHARGEATALVRQALQDGHLDIIAVGGDGTINEAVNGFFEHGATVSPDAVLGFIPAGTHGDFSRGLGMAANYEAAVARLRKAHVRRIDVGRLSCLSLTGAPLTRYFVNAASFGFTASVAGVMNRARVARLFGRRLSSLFHNLCALIGWHSPRLRLIADDHYDEIAGITLVAIANGRWIGGGIEVAPDADPADGLFDIAVMGGTPRSALLKDLKAVRRGNSALRRVRAKRLTAAPTLDTHGPVSIETDGESAGLLPATFEILPNALNLRC